MLGPYGPPLTTNGSTEDLDHLSVNENSQTFMNCFHWNLMCFHIDKTFADLLLSSAVENNYIVSLFEELQNIGISDIWIGVSGELNILITKTLGI